MAVATWPPGKTFAERNSTLEPQAGKCATGIKVSVALRPTPTTSTLDRFVMVDSATVTEARTISKAERLCQLKRVVRQRARPQTTRNKERTAVKNAAGAQCMTI